MYVHNDILLFCYVNIESILCCLYLQITWKVQVYVSHLWLVGNKQGVQCLGIYSQTPPAGL